LKEDIRVRYSERPKGKKLLLGILNTLQLVTIRERLGVNGPRNRENPVKVIDFVLEQFGSITLQEDGLLLPVEVPVPDAALLVPFNTYQDIGETHAVVPQHKLIVAEVLKFRIKKRDWSVDIQVDQPDESAYLWRGNSAADAKTLAEIKQSVV